MFYIVFAIGLLLSLLPQKKLATKLYAAIILAVAVFRYGSGPDYFSYARIYRKALPSVIQEFNNPYGVHEIGFRLIEALFKQFNLSYQVFLAGMAAIGIYYIYKTCVKYSSNPTLSLVVYFACYYFFWTYSALRQGFAMTIGIYFLLEAVRENKTIKFIIIALLLSQVHASAVFLLVLYLASRLKLNKNQLIVFSVLAIIISVLPIGGILLSLSRWIPILSRVIPYVTASQSLNNILDFQTIGRFAFLIIAFAFYDLYSKESVTNKKIMNMYIISFIIYFVLKSSELLAARLAIYGKLLDILILPNIIYLFKSKWNRNAYVTFLVLLLSVYLFKELKSTEILIEFVNHNPYVTPYTNIFNKGNFVFYHP